MAAKKIQAQKFKTGYIDESGDPGKDGSKCLVLTYVSLDERKKITKIFKRATDAIRRTKKGERWLNRTGGELKFYGFPDQHVLIKTLEELAKLQFQIRFIAIYKEGRNLNPKSKSQILDDLLGQAFKLEELPHKIIVDNDYFDNKKVAYIVVEDYKEFTYGEHTTGYSCKIYVAEEDVLKKVDDLNMLIPIRHENSKNDLGLQVVDLISGAIFQEMEHGDKTYTDIIRNYSEIKGRIIRPSDK